MENNTKQFFSKLFNVREGEWRKLLLIFCLNLFLGTATVVSATVSEGLFLTKFKGGKGIEYLPYLFILGAILRVLASIVYAQFVDIVRSDRLFNWFLGLIIIIVIGFRIALCVNWSWVYPLLYAFHIMLYTIIVLHFAMYVYDLYDTQESKRLYPIVSSGQTIGGIIGGFSIGQLSRIIGPENLLYIFIALMVLSILLIIYTGKIYFKDKYLKGNNIKRKQLTKKKKETRNLDNMKRGFDYIKSSDLLKVFAISSFALIMVMQIMDFQYSRIFATIYRQRPEALTSFYGYFTGITNILALILQIFLLPRMISWIGVGTSNLIYPVSCLLSFIGLFCGYRTPGFALFSLSGMSASWARFTRRNLRRSLKKSIDHLTFNAVHLNMRGRARSFISGFVNPIATIVAGLSLLVLRHLNPVYVATIGIVLALFYIYSAWRIKKEYTIAFINMLKDKTVDLSSLVGKDIGKIGKQELASLELTLYDPDEEVAMFGAGLLGSIGGDLGARILLNSLHMVSGNLRVKFIEILGAIKSPIITSHLIDYLSDDDAKVRSNAIHAIANRDMKGLEKRIAEHLKDTDFWVRAESVIILLNHKNGNYISQAGETLDELLVSAEPIMRAAGVYCLGEIGTKDDIVRVLPYLNEANSEIRLQAFLALEKLVNDNSNNITNMVVSGLDDPLKEIRFCSVRIFKKLADPKAIKVLISALGDRSYKMRHLLVEALEVLGKATIKDLLYAVKSPNRDLLKKEFALLALGHIIRTIDKEETQKIRADLLEYAIAELRYAYYAAASISTLEKVDNKRTVELLIKALDDEIERGRIITLKMLEALSNPDTIRLIQKNLKRKNDKRLRSDAIEALENIGDKNLIRMLIPLLDDSTNDIRAEMAQRLWEIQVLDLDGTIQTCLTHPSSWVVACTMFTIGELKLKMYKPVLTDIVSKQVDLYIKEAAIEAVGKLNK